MSMRLIPIVSVLCVDILLEAVLLSCFFYFFFYVDSIFANPSSIIYPTPVNVAQIEVVTRYDNAANTLTALTIMENYYSPAGGKEAK